MSRFRPLSRRAVLRGAGACLGLPLLEVMMPRRAAAAPPLRFVGWFHPNGMNQDRWRPTAEGPLGALPPTLAPLDAVKDGLLVLSGLRMGPPTFAGSHPGGLKAFLTAAANYTQGATDSVDQVIAAKVGGSTRLPSLQLSIDIAGSYEPFTDANKDGFADQPSFSFVDTKDYCSGEDCRLSVSRGARLPTIYNPRVVFEKIFGASAGAGDAMASKRRGAQRKSVLDFAKGQTSLLQGKLGKADNVRLDEYFTGLRELEVAIDKSEQPVVQTATCSATGKPVGVAIDPVERAKLMATVMVKAFECDATRSVSIMMGMGTTAMRFIVDGKLYYHHEASHWFGNEEKRKAKDTIDLRLMEGFAHFIKGLKASKEGAGSLLDNVVVFHSSEISDPNKHDHVELPVILAGRAGGLVKTGRHLRGGIEGRQTGDLFLAILQMFGIQQERFGEWGTKALTEVMG